LDVDYNSALRFLAIINSMPHITLDNASLAFGHHALLAQASFQLDPGERVGLNWSQRSLQIQLSPTAHREAETAKAHRG